MTNNTFKTAIIIVMYFSAIACSSDDGGGGVIAPIGDVNGVWAISENVDARACDDGQYPDNYNLSVSQSGNTLTLTDSASGRDYSGTLNGNQLAFTGTMPADPGVGGTISVRFNGTLGASCESFTGSASWTWSDGVDSCSGTTQVSGTRTIAEGCGSVSSNYDTESEPNDSAGNADVVTLGVPMQATTTSTAPEDDDVYIFTVPSTAKYQFGIDYDQANNSITIALYDYNLVLLETSNSVIGSTTNITAGTVLYIQIDPSSTFGTVPYTLNVNTL